MRPVNDLPKDTARALRGVFCDIDDTLTDGGKLLGEAYEALWALGRMDLMVIPVTGRPAGWCDLIARQWPVDAVVGENGALSFYEEQGRVHRIYHPDVAPVAGGGGRERLDEVREAVLAEVSGSRVASDQAYRLFDLAIDFCEEPPDLGLEAASKIRDIFERFGAHAKISSIHVNGWFGDYDKLAMARLLMQQRWGIDLDEAAERQRWIFVGDSPNDEPMFEFFPNACGVANVTHFAEQMQYLPRYIAKGTGGSGFAEIVGAIAQGRA